MQLTSRINRRFAAVVIGLSLVLLVVLASVAMAYAKSPSVLPVEPDGGIGD